MQFPNASATPANMLYPTDGSAFEMLDRFIQHEYVDPRDFEMRGVLANPQRLFEDGMRTRVSVPVSDPTKVTLVTERAVGTDQGLKFVYVVNDQNTVERRDVKLGRLSDGMQAIRQGLKPEEWVIVNGIQRVRDGI